MPGNGVKVDGGGGEFGSGYRIGEGLVLTAGHVVYEWNRNQTNPQFDTAGLNVVLDFRDYLAKYAEVVALLPAPVTQSNHDIDATPAIVQRDSVVIQMSGGDIGPGDDGLVWFLNPADLTNTNSSALLNSAVKVVRSDRSGTHFGTITAINPQSLTGVLKFSNDSEGGDSGGAYLLKFAGKEYVIGTHFANIGSSDALGTFFSGDEWRALNDLMEPNFTGNITTSEPTNLIVGTSQADIFSGSFRPDRLYGRGGEDRISDGDAPSDTVWANDTLIGGDGADELSAGGGDDVFWGDDENENGFDDVDKDAVSYDAAVAAIQLSALGTTPEHALQVADGSSGIDTLHAVEIVNGSIFNDTFDAGVGRYTLRGGDGEDIFYAHAGNIIEGGAGADKFYFSTREFKTLVQDGIQLIDPSTLDLASYNILETTTLETFLDLRTGTPFPVVTKIAIPKILLLNVDASDKIYIDGTLFDGSGREGNPQHTFTEYDLYHYSNLDTYDERYAALEWAHHDLAGQASINEFVGSRLIDTTLGVGEQEGFAWDKTSYSLTAALVVTIKGLAPGGASIPPTVQLTGTEGDDPLLAGTSQAEGLYGLGGNDHLAGGAGDDLIDGGSGVDTAEYAGASTSMAAYRSLAGVEVWDMAGDEGRDTLLATEFIHFGGDDVTLAVVDLPSLGGQADDLILGSSRTDLLWGFEGSDQIFGLAGADTIIGGDGDDVIDGGDDADVLDGGAGSDALTGGLGNDVLSSSDGLDALHGGGGDDTYEIAMHFDTTLEYNTGTDVIVENDGEGIDSINIFATEWASYQLPDNVENVTADSETKIVLYGNALANTIIGTDWDGVEYEDGDYLDGGAGADLMIGRLGFDVYVVDNVGDVIVEEDNAETDIVLTSLASFTIFDNVERLFYTGEEDFHCIGNASNNEIFGGYYNDILEGGAGDDLLSGYLSLFGGGDTLVGGTGDDIYQIMSDEDVVIENANEGFDMVVTQTQAAFVLSDNVEILWDAGGIGSFTGTGNALDNVLFSAREAELFGLGGADTITGSVYDDVLNGGTGDDILRGGGGDDTLDGGDDEDIAVFVGASTRYDIETIGGVTVVTDLGADDPLTETVNQGADSLTGVEWLQFDDGLVAVGGGSQMRVATALGAKLAALHEAEMTDLGEAIYSKRDSRHLFRVGMMAQRLIEANASFAPAAAPDFDIERFNAVNQRVELAVAKHRELVQV